MAIYEFGCGSCKAKIERIQSFHAPLPVCCGEEMTRLMSLPASPVFIGTGTYATDYGNMPHHLKPYDQRVRAGNECHRNELRVARPGPTDPKTAHEIKQLS
ncbi:hypothetical protein LCGC14_1542130 [marine sediment metagenome]|uniref:Putative regulatory protein FmdB zinc ribbon domain-containing protein n=1 Tax=marine sediment metagenome TaxID=412755 RepID=A0A0F9LTJ8_9ZZZZ